MDEKQAIQQLKNGDIRGLEFLVECHQVKAVRTAYLIHTQLVWPRTQFRIFHRGL